MPYHIAGMAGGHALLKAVETVPPSAFCTWASGHYQDAHMPPMGMHQRAPVMKTPMVEHPQVKMALTEGPENRKWTA